MFLVSTSGQHNTKKVGMVARSLARWESVMLNRSLTRDSTEEYYILYSYDRNDGYYAKGFIADF